MFPDVPDPYLPATEPATKTDIPPKLFYFFSIVFFVEISLPFKFELDKPQIHTKIVLALTRNRACHSVTHIFSAKFPVSSAQKNYS